MEMRSEAAWSYLDPKPLCVYDPKHDAHLVFWNGIVMTRSYALMIYGTAWCSIYYPESQKIAAWKEYQRIYRSGGFDHRSWDGLLERKSYHDFTNSLINFMVMKDKTFFIKLKEKYTAKEALSWFMPSKERNLNAERIQ